MTIGSRGLTGLGRGGATQGTYGIVRTGQPTKPVVTSYLTQTPPPSDVIKLDTGEYVSQSMFGGLTDSEQAYLRKFGVDAFNREQSKVAEQRVEAIAPFKSGEGYDLVKMVGTGYSTERLAEMGFANEAISEAQTYSKALAEVADYETPTGYDLVKAVESGVSDDSLNLLFGKDIVSGTRQMIEDSKQPIVMTAREQFDQWKSTDPSAPKDAVFEGESPDGGFQYSSPSASVMMVEVDTAKGKVTMPVAEWDAMSDLTKYETVLGRAPTSIEWQGYRLLEAGIDLPWWKELVPGAPDFVGRLAKFTPGIQVEERYVDIKQSAVSEWVKAYPNLKWQSVGAGILEELGFSAAKALYPQVTVKDITGKEWAMTGLNVALWTMPKWLPKVTSAGKVLFNIKFTTKTPILRLQVPFERVNLGLAGTKVTWKFPVKLSWGAGLQRAGLSAKIEGIAFDAGKAASDLKIATASAKSFKGALLSPKVASRLKIAQMDSLSADTKFMESLSGLKVTAKQIKLLEQATGYKRLVTPIRNAGIAAKLLDVAWDTVSKTAKMYGMGSRNYIKALEGVTKARAVLGKAVDKLDAILKPRYVESAAPAKFAGYKMGWTETLDTIVPERPVPKSMIPPSSEGGYGKSGTMSKGFYDQQYDRMIESWHTAQPYEAGSRVATKLQTNLSELAEYRLATISKLELTAQYVEQLANEVKLSGYPLFSAEQAFGGLLAVTIGQPLSAKQVSIISEALGVSVKEVNRLATQGQLYQALDNQVSQLHETMMELVIMTDVEAVVRAVPEVKGVSDVELEVLSQIALQTATDAMTKNMTAEQIKDATEAAIQNEVKTATKLQVQTITKTAIKTATSIATKFKTQLKLRLAPGEGETKAGKQGKRPVYPDGSIVWLMGELKRGQEWKAILPPYNQNKPISSTKPPHGVRVTTGTPQETLTFIGGKVPFRNVAFDLGITDGWIDVKHKRIDFTGGGLKTNVGTRIPSATRGIAMDDEIGGLTAEQLRGAVAWKHGFIYIMKFPPYGKDDVKYSRTPFKGVKTVEGAKSAYETIVRIGGQVPKSLKQDMGIMDVEIKTPDTGKPSLVFTRRLPRGKARRSKISRQPSRMVVV